MADEVEKKTKRFLPKQLWIVLELDENGGYKGYDIVKDIDDMMSKLERPDFMTTHRVIKLNREELYA